MQNLNMKNTSGRFAAVEYPNGRAIVVRIEDDVTVNDHLVEEDVLLLSYTDPKDPVVLTVVAIFGRGGAAAEHAYWFVQGYTAFYNRAANGGVQ